MPEVEPEDPDSPGNSTNIGGPITQAASVGNNRDLLAAMRERIARTVDDPKCPPRDLAALTRRLQDIAKEIDLLDLRAKQESAENGERIPDEPWDEEAI